MRASVRLLLPGLVGLVCSLFFVLVPTGAEYAFFDLRMALVAQARATGEGGADTAVILMDAGSEGALGVQQGPEWRRFHPELIRTLLRAGARVIVFDAQFDASTPWDTELLRACVDAGNVVAGELTAGATDPALRSGFAAIGDLNFGSARGRPRSVSLPQEGGAQPLAVVVARLFNPALAPPSDASERLWINFDFPVSTIPAFSYVDVLRATDERIADAGHTPLSILRDRVVLIGKDMPGEGDRFAYPHTFGKEYPGVYGQVYAVETLLRHAPIRRSPVLDAALLLVLCALLDAILLLRRRLWRALSLIVLPVAALVASTALLARAHLWVGYAGLLAAFLAALATHWILRRLWLTAHLRRAIGFRPELIESFRASSRRSGGTVLRHAAILSSDVRSYTRFVADNPPEVAARVMSGYVRAMERIVTAHEGYVNKYVGDEIVAVFGFPLREEGAEDRAARAAIAMLEELPRLREGWRAEGLPRLEAIGIGIDSGTLTFAEVGGASKVQFDIIGNPVNGASRLQTLTKETRRPLLASAECLEAVLEPATRDRFESLGPLAVRGQGEREVFGLRTPEG